MSDEFQERRWDDREAAWIYVRVGRMPNESFAFDYVEVEAVEWEDALARGRCLVAPRPWRWPVIADTALYLGSVDEWERYPINLDHIRGFKDRPAPHYYDLFESLLEGTAPGGTGMRNEKERRLVDHIWTYVYLGKRPGGGLTFQHQFEFQANEADAAWPDGPVGEWQDGEPDDGTSWEDTLGIDLGPAQSKEEWEWLTDM